MRTYHVHFVCKGNFYRSRLAEAYLRSKRLPNVEVSSSGVQSDEYYDKNGPISWYALRLMKKYNLIPHMKKLPTQTTAKYLDLADIVIFMTDEHLKYAKKKFRFKNNSFEIWNIDDVNQADFYQTDRDSDEMRIAHSEKTFALIRKKVDELARRIANSR